MRRTIATETPGRSSGNTQRKIFRKRLNKHVDDRKVSEGRGCHSGPDDFKLGATSNTSTII